MFIDSKKINFKITKNGKFQFTGCKFVSQAKKACQHLWGLMNKQAVDLERLYSVDGGDPSISFLTVMTNIDFNVGFNINREQLDQFINSSTMFNSLLETSFGYTGVNIKILVEDRTDFDMERIHMNEDGVWEDGFIKFSDYLVSLSDTDMLRITSQPRYNTFLIFQSGNIIMSGYNKVYMRNVYEQFAHMLVESREFIEEKL